MKNILVYNVAAEEGGAVTILNEFYNEFKKDTKNNYIFVLSVIDLEETENIKIINLPWVKKSKLHRLFCDYIYMKNLMKRESIDEVFSLQNMTLPRCKMYQTVYVHNAIPFTEHKFSFSKERYLWIYQNIIGRMIKNSLKKANSVITQTEWMKKKIINDCNIKDDCISVKKVNLNFLVRESYEKPELSTFFYPASVFTYKNHITLINACILLKKQFAGSFRLVLTIDGTENELAKELVRKVEMSGINYELIGRISHEEVLERYKNSILVFPSYLETVGLPLMEASAFNTPIIAADCEYAREVLDGYENVKYFSPLDSLELSRCLAAYCDMESY